MVVGDAAARAAERKRRPEHDRITELPDDRLGIGNGIGVTRPSGLDAELGHAVVEQLAVFPAFDRLKVAADHLDAVLLEHARTRKVDRRIEAGLPAERGKQRVGTLPFDDLFNKLGGDGFDVGTIGKTRIGHDGCRIGIHEHDAVSV